MTLRDREQIRQARVTDPPPWRFAALPAGLDLATS
jgi:hypothetical protein